MKRHLFFTFILLVMGYYNVYGQEEWVIRLKNGQEVTYDIDNINEMFPRVKAPVVIPFNAISFNATIRNMSGNDVATALNNRFFVEVVKGDGTIDNQICVMDNYTVNYIGTSGNTTSNTSAWEYLGGNNNQTIKYWDYKQKQYDFLAYSIGNVSATFGGGITRSVDQLQITGINAAKMNGVKDATGKIIDGAYKIKGKVEDIAQIYIADLVTAYFKEDMVTYPKEVNIDFRPLAAKVRLAFYETIPGYWVKDLQFYSSEDDTTPNSVAKLYTSDPDIFNEEGTCTIFYPTTGAMYTSDPDYNKAHVAFTSEATGTGTMKEFGTLENNYLGNASTYPTYTGNSSNNYYIFVLPDETGATLNIKVNYKLVAQDGSGEVINVVGAKAQIPVRASIWQSGYCYTYIFKISEVMGPVDPTLGAANLFPITFDALVVKSEDDSYDTTTW